MKITQKLIGSFLEEVAGTDLDGRGLDRQAIAFLKRLDSNPSAESVMALSDAARAKLEASHACPHGFPCPVCG